jgi:hypothetical protein
MKKYKSLFIAIILSVLMTASVTAVFAQEEQAQDDALFTIARMVIAGSVEDREPVGVVDAFASSTERVYCFLEATQIKEDFTVKFVWYHGDQKTAEVALSLRQGSRWRTYSSKKLGGRTGNWTVELQDTEGNMLHSVGFTVE